MAQEELLHPNIDPGLWDLLQTDRDASVDADLSESNTLTPVLIRIGPDFK